MLTTAWGHLSPSSARLAPPEPVQGAQVQRQGGAPSLAPDGRVQALVAR